MPENEMNESETSPLKPVKRTIIIEAEFDSKFRLSDFLGIAHLHLQYMAASHTVAVSDRPMYQVSTYDNPGEKVWVRPEEITYTG